MIGGLLVVTFPGVAALSISLWIGVLAIVWGAVLVVAGFHVRKSEGQPAAGPGQS